MRITMLCLEWPSDTHTGGVARYAYRMASQLAELVDLTIVTPEGGRDLPGARIVPVRKPRSRIDRFYLLPAVLRDIVKRQSPDLIHSFGDDFLIKRDGTPIVRSFFGSSWSEAKSSRGLRRINHSVLALTEKYTEARSSFRIAIAPETVDVFNCHMLMPPVSPVPQLVREPTRSPSVVFIGSFNGRKRGSFAEQAVREVSHRLGRDVTFTVVGPADDKKYWHKSTVHLSNASDIEVQRLISKSWVLVSPSSYEGFGIPMFEALSLGVPTLATANPGSSYLAGLVRQGDALALAESDHDFMLMLEQRISRGPMLTDEASAAARTAVDALLNMASVPRLVRDVYGPLIINS
ncbi:glycosyltransferase family 4 protein [Pseudarthrobacter phenanthrenivorans]|uniref:glycosyltransferase family 4 protein n=1 Tax=Pseudarthrobacter phenanthrenivorans TaxID=361575 RepID=UPI002F350A67